MPSLEEYISRYDYLQRGGYGYSALSFEPIIPVKPAAPKPKPEPKFKAGDKVNVKIDAPGVVDYVSSWGNHLDIVLDDGTPISINTKFVTLADPENWPPKSGQVWKAGGKLYGVRQHVIRTGTVTVYQVDDPSNGYSDDRPSKGLDAFKALRPTLVG